MMPYDFCRHVRVMADTPHLLKLMRNHLLDQGATLPGGVKVDKAFFSQVLGLDDGREYRILPRVAADTHLGVSHCVFQR